MYDVVIFDLDGTVSNPEKGITESFRYALSHLNVKIPSQQTLRTFIGPPLWETFSEKYEFNKSKTGEAVRFWREYFTDKGIYENKLYDGMEELLQKLVDRGLKIAIATTKPQVFADRVVRHFKIDNLFSLVVGSDLDGGRSDKSTLISEVLSSRNVSGGRAVMVGDRAADIEGAQSCGIDSIGVAYGFGSEEELKNAGATKVVLTVTDLARLLLCK